VRACTSSCLDVCWAGPVIAVEPDGYFYGHVTLADVPRIADALANGTRVEELVLTSKEYDEPAASGSS
jgi:(2Fe-2S) ferredoxin